MGILQRLFWTVLHTLQAEDTLRSIFSLSGIIRYIYLHRTHPLTLSAGDTFAFVTPYPQQGIITHRLQKHRDRADVFAERTVVLESKRERYADDVVEQIPDDKRPEHDPFHIASMRQKQGRHKN